MKKTFKKIASISLLAVVMLTSCSKDDEPNPVTYQEENPIPTFLQISGFNFSRSTVASGDSEVGFGFTSKVTGKINSLIAKLHVANPNLKVTIWDKDLGTAIATNYLNVATANTDATMSITPVVLQKNKEYVITMKTSYYFQYQKQSVANQTYPVDSGNISITGCYGGNPNQMPGINPSNYFLGDISFVFQQTE